METVYFGTKKYLICGPFMYLAKWRFSQNMHMQFLLEEEYDSFRPLREKSLEPIYKSTKTSGNDNLPQAQESDSRVHNEVPLG